MVNAMTSSLGVHGLSVTLCESLQTPYNQIHVKLEDVSSFSNVEYNTYLRVWKAYGIRPGKKITSASLGIAKHDVTASACGCTQLSSVKFSKFCIFRLHFQTHYITERWIKLSSWKI